MWRNIIIGIALFSLVALDFLYNRYQLRQKNRYQQQLNRQQNELFNDIMQKAKAHNLAELLKYAYGRGLIK